MDVTDRAVHPGKKGVKKSSPPRYPFISLITAGPVFSLEGSVLFRSLSLSLFPSEINKPAANALVRAQYAAICLGGFVYLALINFNNKAQPSVIKRPRERSARLASRRGPFLQDPPHSRKSFGSARFHPRAEFMVTSSAGARR